MVNNKQLREKQVNKETPAKKKNPYLILAIFMVISFVALVLTNRDDLGIEMMSMFGFGNYYLGCFFGTILVGIIFLIAIFVTKFSDKIPAYNRIKAERRRTKMWIRGCIFFMTMTVMIVLLMGAIHAKYPYDSIFKEQVNKTLTDALGTAGTGIAEGLVSKTYDAGAVSPTLIILAFIGSCIYGAWWIFLDKYDDYEDADAQYILDDLNDYYNKGSIHHKTDLKDIEMLMQGKMRKSALDYIKKQREKEISKKSQLPYVVIETNSLKGGKNRQNGNNS